MGNGKAKNDGKYTTTEIMTFRYRITIHQQS